MSGILFSPVLIFHPVLVCYTVLVALFGGTPAPAPLSGGPSSGALVDRTVAGLWAKRTTTGLPASRAATGLLSPRPVTPPVILQDRAAPPPDGSGPRVPEKSVQGAFDWPLPGSSAVVRAFQPPTHRYGPGHRGVDLAAPPGSPVLAAGAGTVVFAGQVAGRGVVSIDHPNGVRTTYQPILPSVTSGALVTKGEQIGIVQAGHPGCPTMFCLHWGARRGMDYLDPLRLLKLPRVRLLPWDGGVGSS